MRNQNENSSKQTVRAELHGSSARERFLHRLHCVVMVQHGFTASDVSRIFGDSPRAVAYWVVRYANFGEDGLIELKKPGRISSLTEEQLEHLRTWIKGESGKGKAVNGAKLSSYLKESFGISLAKRQCWRVLKQVLTG